MRHSKLLTVLSVLSAVLFSIHVTDDMVHGFDRVGIQNVIGIVILVVWVYGALVLVDRRSGLIVVLLAGLFAFIMPVMHWRGATVSSPAFASSPGAFRFLWILWALGTTGLLSFILAVQGLWSSRRTADSRPRL